MKTEWENISIPKKLYKDVEEIVIATGHWATVPEFVRDAVRDQLNRVKSGDCEGAGKP